MTPRNVQDAIHLHRGRSIQHLAEAMGQSLDVTAQFGSEEWADLLFAGNAAFDSLSEKGWDLMFDANGKFIGVVT